MGKAEAVIKDEKKLQLTSIKDTPFVHATDGVKNYVISGKVLLETEKNKQETEDWLKEKPWEAIALLCQAITDQMTKKN